VPTADISKRRAFAQHYAVHGNASAAARAAGVPESSAHSMGYKWLRNNEVTRFIREEIDSQLRELGPVAIGVLKGLMADETAPASTRLGAARDVMDRLGWVPPKRSEIKFDAGERTADDLTTAELEQIIADARWDDED
jgi:phage terminase small subunit